MGLGGVWGRVGVGGLWTWLLGMELAEGGEGLVVKVCGVEGPVGLSLEERHVEGGKGNFR